MDKILWEAGFERDSEEAWMGGAVFLVLGTVEYSRCVSCPGRVDRVETDRIGEEFIEGLSS